MLTADRDHRGVDVIVGWESNDGIDIRGMLVGVDLGEDDRYLNDVVQLSDEDGGTMLRVLQGDAFVDVVLIAGIQTGGATASAWAADGLLLT